MGCSLKNIKQMFSDRGSIYRTPRRNSRKYGELCNVGCDQYGNSTKFGTGSRRKYFLYSGMAGAYFSWICDAGRNGGGIFPGASGNETESACGNPQ